MELFFLFFVSLSDTRELSQSNFKHGDISSSFSFLKNKMDDKKKCARTRQAKATGEGIEYIH